ncbi:hypothetical protein OAR47_03630 [Gammaproteobacteria bacterium]|nr:hypothetical protein [Gammaproteobacteria bacterium]
MPIFPRNIEDLISRNKICFEPNTFRELGKSSKDVREEIVGRLMKLPGDSNTPKYHHFYTSICKNYKIFARKPGKEANLSSRTNIFDLYIYIEKNGTKMDIGKSFGDIFISFEGIKQHTDALELMAYILIRNAYCLDHDPAFVYSPSTDIITFIEKKIKSIHKLPVDVFLHFLEAIASNEDVKYSNKKNSKGKYNSLGVGTGRRNNMLTYVYVIASFQNKIKVSEVMGKLASSTGGIAPIDSKSLQKHFPLISGE